MFVYFPEASSATTQTNKNYTAKVRLHDIGRPEESSTTTQTNKSYTAMVWPHDISGPEESSTTTQTNIKLHSGVFESA